MCLGADACWCWLQVVNREDLTEILGERPFKSAEILNIDKFRDGFAKDAVDNTPDALPGSASGGEGSSTGTPGVVDVPSAKQGRGIEQPAAPPVPGPDSTMKPRRGGSYAS